MRIGTWNLAGGWGAEHRAFLRRLECDVLLLTEVPFGCDPDGFQVHHTADPMTSGRAWAAICSAADLAPMPDPEHATAMAQIDGLRVCCSVLPWRSCGRQAGWPGETTADRTRGAVAAIESARPDVWGGDWNHSLTGSELARSMDGAPSPRPSPVFGCKRRRRQFRTASKACPRSTTWRSPRPGAPTTRSGSPRTRDDADSPTTTPT